MKTVLSKCSVAQLCPNSFRPHALQHTRLPCPSLSPGACSNSHPLNQWCHPTISFSVVSSSCLQSFPTSGSFPMSRIFLSYGQSYGAWSFSWSISPSIEYSGLIFFRIDCFDYYQNEPVFVLNQRASGKVKTPMWTLTWFPEVRLTSGGMFGHHI